MKFSNLLILFYFSLPPHCLGDEKQKTELPKISLIVDNLMVNEDFEIVSGKGNYGSINFDDSMDKQLRTSTKLRDLGNKNNTCVDRDHFLQVSQRYIIMNTYDAFGFDPLKYQPGLSEGQEVFDECKWAGIECTNGIIHRILLKNVGLSPSNDDGIYPPSAVEYLLNLEVLDLSENPILGGELNPALNKLPNLRVLDISRSGLKLKGEFGCSEFGQTRFITYGGAPGGQFVGRPDEDNDLFSLRGDFKCTCPKDVCYNLNEGGLQEIADYDDSIPIGNDGVQIDEDVQIDDDVQINDGVQNDGVIVGSSGGNRRRLNDDCVSTDRILWQKFQQRWALTELFYVTNVVPSTKLATDRVQYGGVDNNFNKDECTWLGVSCNGMGLVTRLNLKGAGLTSGRAILSKFNTRVFEIQPEDILPDSLTWLENLEFLDLSRNPLLVGNLPSDLHHLRNLRFIDVSQTNLAGRIKCNKGGLSKLISFGGTRVSLGEGTGQGSTLSSQGGDTSTTGSWEEFNKNEAKFDDGIPREYEPYIAGATRFGINCACSKDICLKKKADIREKPYDRK